MRNQPRNNHYVPDFLLKRWIGVDNKVTYFEWLPTGALNTGRCGSRGAGFQRDLYSQMNPSGDVDTSLERELFTKLVDEPSAPVHVKLLDGQLGTLSEDERSHWSRFLVAQMVRVPSMVQYLCDAGRQMMLRDVKDIEPPEEIKAQLEGTTLEQYLRTDAAWRLDNASKRALEIIIQSQLLNDVFLKAHWAVHPITASNVNFVIGDRPLLLEGRMTDLFLFALPLSPTQLFLASNDCMAICHVAAENQRDLVRTVNRESAEVADKYVYATDGRQAALAERYLRKFDAPDDRHIVSGLRTVLRAGRPAQ
ncbi:DUF4238 domain-containing protein [Burkholderia sp. BCC1988]|uniref:DUF4238 domain-containing protein n=1 Tax=Burkholderia sp. BCC1988 TaxID=2817443 RepID=UPI002AB224C5|nr:DUF4238 domain-containing protein [Burkholderia sp. BCC1988]